MLGYDQIAHPVDYRYGSSEMRKIFSVENIYRTYALVELAVAEAQSELGLIPKDVPKMLKKAINELKYEEILEEEKVTKHDLFALLNVLIKKMGKLGQYIHVGLTSSDVKDTALILIIRDALILIKKHLISLTRILITMADTYKNLVCVARTHGVHANIYVFGYKFAIWADEFGRHLQRLQELENRLYVGKLSGSVGIHVFWGKLGEEIEERALRRLNLKKALGVNQVIQRDIFAEVIMKLSLISTSLDKIATEIRNLQRTEILEVEEPFKRKQIGSSAMPHKRNPILSENVSSLARIARGLVIPALENIVLWHERDLTNSASERIIFPEIFIIVEEQLRKMHHILSNLKVNEDKIKEKISMTNGLIFSELLVAYLVKKGVPRAEAYSLVHNLSQNAWENNLNFKDVVYSNSYIKKYLNDDELKDLFNPEKHIGVGRKRIEEIAKKVYKLLNSLEN